MIKLIAALTVAAYCFAPHLAHAQDASASSVSALAASKAPCDVKAGVSLRKPVTDEVKAARKAKAAERKAVDEAAASAKGQTLKEYRADRKAERDEAKAAKAGMSVAEYLADRKAKAAERKATKLAALDC